MSQSPRNAIDIPLLGEQAEDFLIDRTPIVGAADFAMRERPPVKGEDKRGVWRRFSDWVFDGILPESQTNFYGTGEDPELNKALQEKAALQRRGGKPFVDKDAGDANRLAADLLVGFMEDGEMPLEGTEEDQLADDIMLDMARATISDPNASAQEREEASEVVGDRALRQMIEKQQAEGELAGMSNGDDLTKRIVEMYADGKGEEEIGAELREAGWDYSMGDNKQIDRLGQEVEILLDQGELGRAKALTFARLNLMKNGGAVDANLTPYDQLLDAYIQADTANMSASDAFSIAGTDAFLSTIRGIGRLTGMGYTTEKDRDILEKMTAESYKSHPIASLSGSFAGGFVDPVFFGISMGAAKAPITAAQKSRYVNDLIARGTPKAIAAKMGARATAETVATNRLTKYFLNRGLSMRTAQAAGALTWNISDAAITNAVAEGIVAAGEEASPTEIALRSLKGAGVGATMGIVLDRAFRGIDKVSRVLTRKIPAKSAGRLDDAISYAAAQGSEGQELSTKLRDLTRAWDDAGDRLGRKLTNNEADEIAQGLGVNLDELAELRKSQVQELKARRKAREEQAQAGDGLTALEMEAIEKGIMKAPSAEPTPAERARQSAEADAELERRYGPELDAEEAGIIKQPEPEPTPEQRKKRAAEADAELERRYGPELEREEAKKAGKFPDRLTLDDLAELEAPSADLGPDPTAKDLAASKQFQKDNINTLDHQGDEFVKSYVPIEELEVTRDAGDELEAGEYAGMDPATRPPIAAGPPIAGELAQGKTMLVPDGSRRVAAAKQRGETEIIAYVPEWYAKKRNLTLPKHLRELTEGGKVVDRTPEGYGPDGQTHGDYQPQEPPPLPDMPGPKDLPKPRAFERPPGRAPEDLGAGGEQGAVIPELAEDVAEQERMSKIGMRERGNLGLEDTDPLAVGRAIDSLQNDADNFRLEKELYDEDELDLEELDYVMRDVVSDHFEDQGIELPEFALDDLTARMVGRAQPVLEAKLRQKLAKEKASASATEYAMARSGIFGTGDQRPKSSKPATLEGFIGEGRADQGAVYADGADGPILGPGTYMAASKSVAQRFGPNVRAEQMTLNKPFVIESPATIERLMGAPMPRDNAARVPYFREMRKLLERRGYDGAIVQIPTDRDVAPDGSNLKRNREVFDSTQAIKFEEPNDGQATTTRPDAEREPVPAEPEQGAGPAPESSPAAPEGGRGGEPGEPAPRADEPGRAGEPDQAPETVENPPESQETPEYLEEVESEQEDARFFVDTREYDKVTPTDQKAPAHEIRRRRRELKKKIAEAEKITKLKNPAGTMRKPSAGGGKKIPTMRKASDSSKFLKEVDKIVGFKPSQPDAFVDVSGRGTTAIFTEGKIAVRAHMSAWPELANNGWANDGRYKLEGENIKPAPEHKKRISPDATLTLFSKTNGTIELGEMDLQDLVRDARRLKILSEGNAAVLARNPDGSIGWAVNSYEGSTTVRAQDGAEPLGMFNIERLEKLARVLQRGGETRVSVDIRQIAKNDTPRLTSANIVALRGTFNEGLVASVQAGKNQSVELPDEFKSPAPPKDDTSPISPRGPGESGRDIQRTQAAGSEPLPVEGITGTGVDDVLGVPGDQMRLNNNNAFPQAGVDPGIKRPEPPDWVRQPATTRQGKRAVGRIKSDPKGMKYGVRSIAEALTNALDPLLVRQVREQTSARNPAHYSPHAHMVRTRSATEPNWMFHEQGHAISALIRQANPSFLTENKASLLEIANWPGSMASKDSPEEGFAEFIRRLIVSPKMMNEWPATDGIIRSLESVNPKIIEAVRDAARAFDAYMQRPLDARWRSYMNDTKGRPFSSGRVLSRALVDYVSRGFAPELATRRVMTEVRKEAKTVRDGWKAVEKVESRLKNTAADMIPAYQSLNHIGQMTNIALEGPGKVKPGTPTGLRVHATVVPDELAGEFLDRPRSVAEGEKSSPSMLSEGEREILEAGGFNIPDAPAKHGDIVILADKSVKDAIEPIGKEDWPEFETYAQMKATVARIRARALEGESFPYQTQGEGANPIDLINEIKRQDKANPKWAKAFDDLQEIANATLLLDVMSGEISASDAVKLKNRFEHYIPLTRQGEGGARAIRSGASPSPTANIRRSRGSVNPAEPLLMAMARKLDEAINAYYWNRFAISPLMLAQSLQKMSDVPWTAKIAANRMAIPLKLDTKKLASASPEEVRKAIHEYIVKQVQAGNEMFNLDPEELMSFTPEDIGIVDGFDIWRRVPPKAVNVLAPNINGRRRYYQVLDDNLYRIFAEGGEQINTVAKISENLFGSATQSLKNQITQSFVFAFRSLARDPLTAFMFGDDPQAMVPLFYHAVGAKAMLTGRKPDSLVSPELLSRVFRQVTPEDFAKQRSKAMELLTEGLVPRGWRDMNALSRSLSAPGIAFRILMKPVELKQVLTGQRALASAMETAPRLGAYIMAKRRGLGDEAAQLAADTVTGNFSERPLSRNAHSIYRTAGFLNPAFQIFGQTVKIGLDPVPARAAARAATISGSVAFWTSTIWALNYLASTPEERKRNAERTDQERLTHMDIKGFRVPFDYGIMGGVQSYTYNTLDQLAGGKGVNGEQVARKIISEVMPHTSLNPLEMMPMTAKAGAEASMGYSLYRQETIEPPYMQYLEPQDRYFDTTPDLYRWVGKMANVSPIRAQYFVRNGLGVQLDDAIRSLDRIEQGLEMDELASLPEIGRAFSREPVGWNSASVREAADLGREYDMIRRRAKRMSENPDLDQAALSEMIQILEKLQPVKDAMLDIQKVYDLSKDAAQTDPERARELKRQMVEIARQGLIQMQELENEGNTSNEQ